MMTVNSIMVRMECISCVCYLTLLISCSSSQVPQNSDGKNVIRVTPKTQAMQSVSFRMKPLSREVFQGEQLDLELILSNSTDIPVSFSLRTACDCMLAEPRQGRLEMGDELSIRVRIDTRLISKRKLRETVVVVTNHPVFAELRLPVEVDITPFLECSWPPNRELAVTSDDTLELGIKLRGLEEVDVTAIACLNSQVKTAIRKDQVPVDNGANYTVQLSFPKNFPLGKHELALVIESNSLSYPQMVARLKCVKGFYAEPQQFSFYSSDDATTDEQTEPQLLTIRALQPFRIDDLQVSHPSVLVQPLTNAGERSLNHRFSVAVIPKALPSEPVEISVRTSLSRLTLVIPVESLLKRRAAQR